MKDWKQRFEKTTYLINAQKQFSLRADFAVRLRDCHCQRTSKAQARKGGAYEEKYRPKWLALGGSKSPRYYFTAMASIYAHPKSKIFHVAFWHDGFQYRKSLRTRNRRRAQEDAKAVQRAVDALKSGRDREGLDLIRKGVPVVDVIFPTAQVQAELAESSKKPLVLRDLHDRWIEHKKTEGKAVRTINTIRHRLVHVLRMFGDDFRVDYLTTEDLAKYVTRRRNDQVAEYTIGRELKVLKGIIEHAVDMEWLADNPLKRNGWPTIKPEARKEFITREHFEEQVAETDLSDEELQDLRSRMLFSAQDVAELVDLAMEKLPELALPLALVAVTGIRRTEVVTAKKSDVSTSKWTLAVASDKGSKARSQVRRTIEVHNSVIPMLREHLSSLKRSDRLLFPVFAQIGGKKRDSDSDKDVLARCDRAHRLLEKLVDGTAWLALKGWHTLRHSTISLFLDQGYTFDQIAKWTGHVDPETQKLYTHWFDNQARERMDRLPFDFGNGNGRGLQNGTTDNPTVSTVGYVDRVLAENRALKAQLKMMQAERARIDSLRHRIRVLERRLALNVAARANEQCET